jgi:hypothetical protein
VPDVFPDHEIDSDRYDCGLPGFYAGIHLMVAKNAADTLA